jgi:1-acyl-sn-glycerol-3-phosphate acyltransferase
MQPKKDPALNRFIRWVVGVFYQKTELVGLENLPDEACVIVGNHCQAHGPIITEERFPFNHYTWCNYEMMDLKEVSRYAMEDFWSGKPKYIQPLFWVISRLIKYPAVYVMTNARTIPVYHDNRCISTFRKSIEKLQEGYHLVIYPESRKRYNNIVYDFQDRFIDLAKMYYKRTGKILSFVPAYLAPTLKKVFFGKPIAYRPEIPMDEQRGAIKQQLMDAITQIACAQPLHTVIPYRNISKKNYPKNLPYEVYSDET